MRRRVGSVYLALLLPALMGLFAQIGGSESPVFWRVSIVVVTVIGCASTVTCSWEFMTHDGHADPT